MIYAYIRVSTDKQSIDNQRYEILKFADQKKIKIDSWVGETFSGMKSVKDRVLGELLKNLIKDDTIIISELSRLGLDQMEVMSILHDCMDKDVKVFTLKEGYELGKNINSKILAFAFSLSAEIERNLISQRTKEALARKKSEGITLGRPKGSQNKQVKLSGKEEIIKELLEKKISVSAIARITEVNRLTVSSFIQTRKLKKTAPPGTPLRDARRYHRNEIVRRGDHDQQRSPDHIAEVLGEPRDVETAGAITRTSKCPGRHPGCFPCHPRG